MATINGTSVGGMTLQADYSYTQNASANTSTVTVTLKLINHYALYATAISGSYISVGGNKSNYSKSISYGGSTTTSTTLATKTVTVTHNSDGTATCNIAGTFIMNGTYRDSYVGTMSVNQTITLPKIARSSSFTVSSSVNTGSAISGTVTPSSTAFNHKIQLKIGSTVKDTITLAVGTTTFSYTIPHSWFPSSTSGTVSAVLQTYNGTTLIATTSKNITANVPASIVPSVSAFTAAIAANGLSGSYVQSKTTAKLTATAAAGSGSSIKSYTYSGPNITSSGNSTTTTANNITTAAIKSSGTLTYTVQVQDNRGRTASKTVTISVQPYSVPSISSVSVKRCDANGNLSDSRTYARYTINSSYSAVGGNNTRTVTVAYSSNNGSSYSAETTLQAATDTVSTKTGTYGGGAFAVASSYVLRFTIKDAYGATATMTAPLQSAARPINISANGKGVAIGGMSTKNAFEVSMAADFNSSVNIDGVLMLKGGLAGPLSVVDGGTGANNAKGIAASHHHSSMANASVGQGSPGYVKIASFKISGSYVNQVIEFKVARRQDTRTTTIYIGLQSTEHTDPGLTTLHCEGPALPIMHKSGTSVWDLYIQKTEYYDHISILDFKQGSYSEGMVNVTFPGQFVETLPSGVVYPVRLDADNIVASGTQNSWNVRKWSSGVAECWRTLTGTLSPYTTINGFSAYEGSVAFPTDFFIARPNVQFQAYIGNGFGIPARGVISTNTQCKWVALSNVSAANTSVQIDAYAIGTWK
jgi:hypothetical protein